MTCKKAKKGRRVVGEHEGHRSSWSCQSTGRSIAQMAKVWCTGLSPVNIISKRLSSKTNFGAQIILEMSSKLFWTDFRYQLYECIENFSKSISYAFVPPSEQKQVEMFL